MLRLVLKRQALCEAAAQSSRSISYHSGPHRFNQGVRGSNNSSTNSSNRPASNTSEHASSSTGADGAATASHDGPQMNDSNAEAGSPSEPSTSKAAFLDANLTAASNDSAQSPNHTPTKLCYKKRRRRLRVQRQQNQEETNPSEPIHSQYSLPAVPILGTRPRSVIEDDFFAGPRPLLAVTVKNAHRIPWEPRDLLSRTAPHQAVREEAQSEEYDEFSDPDGMAEHTRPINEVRGATKRWAHGTAAYLAAHGRPFQLPRSPTGEGPSAPAMDASTGDPHNAFNQILGTDARQTPQQADETPSVHFDNVESELQRALRNLKRLGIEEDKAVERFFAPLQESAPDRSTESRLQDDGINVSLTSSNTSDSTDHAEVRKIIQAALETASFLPRQPGQGFLISIVPVAALTSSKIADASSPESIRHQSDDNFNDMDTAAVLSRLGLLNPMSNLPPPLPPQVPSDSSTDLSTNTNKTADPSQSGPVVEANEVARTFQVEHDDATGKWTAKEIAIEESVFEAGGKSRKLSFIDLIKQHIQASPSQDTSFFSRSFMPTTLYTRFESSGRKPRTGRRLTLGPRLLAFRGGRTLGRLHIPESRLYFARATYIPVNADGAEIDSESIVWLDSVKRKRKLKMNKHKIKKRRKVNKSERKRLKK